MKRSEINKAFRDARACFHKNGWHLPPEPRWDVTDFGLGDFGGQGLVLVNLAEEAEYCEKLMYAVRDQATPLHYHKKKKEDIICRSGRLAIRLWQSQPSEDRRADLVLRINGRPRTVAEGSLLVLEAGERITIEPLTWHSFHPASDECIIGEVSTANDDLNDNFFADPQIGRYPEIDEDAPREVVLLSERN